MSIDWAHFTPGAALVGGAMIGAAATLLWLGLGRIAGNQRHSRHRPAPATG